MKKEDRNTIKKLSKRLILYTLLTVLMISTSITSYRMNNTLVCILSLIMMLSDIALLLLYYRELEIFLEECP